MSFEDFLRNGIPLHDASRFFLSLTKRADAEGMPPDAAEGSGEQFAAPVEVVLQAMGKQVQLAFETHMAYKTYAQALRDVAGDEIAQGFEEHAAEEMSHAEFLIRNMSALGGPVHIPDVQAPPASTIPEEITRRLMGMEQALIAGWQELLELIGGGPTAEAIASFMQAGQARVESLGQLLSGAAPQGSDAGAVPGQPPVGMPGGMPDDAALDAQKVAMQLRFIKAANELFGGHSEDGDQSLDEYLAQEEEASIAQYKNEADYYKQQAQQAQQQAQSAQMQSQQTQQQVEQMGQQLQEVQSQVDGTLQQAQQSTQQAQQVQQQALQSTINAQSAATKAMQQTMMANNELLDQQQLSANMRDAYQQMQQQIMQVAQTPPPPATTMEAGVNQQQQTSDAEMAQQAMMPGMEQEGMPPEQGAEGMDPGQPGMEPGMDPGQQGMDPGMGPPPEAGPMPGPEAGGMPMEGAPPMGGMAPQGGQAPQGMPPGNPSMQGMPGKMASARYAKNLEVMRKLANQSSGPEYEKTGSMLDDLKQYAGQLPAMARAHAPQLAGAAIGAGAGAALPHLVSEEKQMQQMDALRARIADLEARGELGWKDELGLIKDRAALGLEEFAQKHPLAATATTALAGAGAGASTGAVFADILKNNKPDPLGFS